MTSFTALVAVAEVQATSGDRYDTHQAFPRPQPPQELREHRPLIWREIDEGETALVTEEPAGRDLLLDPDDGAPDHLGGEIQGAKGGREFQGAIGARPQEGGVLDARTSYTEIEESHLEGGAGAEGQGLRHGDPGSHRTSQLEERPEFLLLLPVEGAKTDSVPEAPAGPPDAFAPHNDGIHGEAAGLAFED